MVTTFQFYYTTIIFFSLKCNLQFEKQFKELCRSKVKIKYTNDYYIKKGYLLFLSLTY
jgi:hypothetical protein